MYCVSWELICRKKVVKMHKPYGIYEKFLKRLLDCIISLCGLIICSPILAIVAILVKVNLGTPVIFQQERPGKDEQIFKLYKFRTMTSKKNSKGELLPDTDRLTKFGRLLRATSLDELPELFNVLKGDMSLIGPRPLLVKYLPYYTEEERHRHDIRPGLTGLAQVHGRNFLNWEDRFTLDCDYVKKITFKRDVSILLRTIWKVIEHADIMENSEQVTFKNLDEERK